MPDQSNISRLESPAKLALGGFLIVLFLALAYANSFRVPFVFDDVESITDNATIRSFSTALMPPPASGITVSGRPVVNASLALNYAIGGTRVTGYHLLNLLLHATTACILWALLTRTFRQPVFADRYRARAAMIAWWITALWALHPMQTIAVTYTIQRAEILVSLFYLLTVYGFARSTDVQSRFWMPATVVACAAGMASKEVMVSAPLIVLLYDRTFISGTFAESWRRHRKLHLSLAATWIVLAVCILQSAGRGSSTGYLQISAWEYALTQTAAITRYVWLSVWPVQLTFDYGPVIILQPSILIPCVLFVGTLFSATIFALRRFPPAGFMGACFFLILAPSSSVVPILTQTIAEHRMYLPLAVVITAGILSLFKNPRRWTVPLLAALLIAAGIRTHLRNTDYRSDQFLWEDTVARAPDNPRAFYNLGVILFTQGQVASSIPLFQKAVSLAPAYAAAHNNLGYAYLRLNRASEAAAAFAQASHASPPNDLFQANLGDSLLAAGQPEAALAAYQTAARLSPQNAAHAVSVAETLLALGRLDDGIAHYRAALAAFPRHAEISDKFSAALIKRDRYAEAIPILQNALRGDTDSARRRSNLALALVNSGRVDEGFQEFRNTLRAHPADDDVRYAFAGLLAVHERIAEAVAEYEILLARGATADLLDMLGMLYARLGRFTEARAALVKALALDPAHATAGKNLARLDAFLAAPPPR